ncbi:GDSL-type esterase/lipase family protein [Streptomyces sp. 8N706]|uniref:GDSL-type esterase/lipase family protein n=1 Tax=Streptomyces sp. 8N706 TaxID=3457416 RepID=UPI003FD57EE3
MRDGWLDPDPYLRGAPWRHEGRVVRADPDDRLRLPLDTWERAQIPAGVRLEFSADGASALEVRYEAGEPGPADEMREPEPAFELWRSGERLSGTPGGEPSRARDEARSTTPGDRPPTDGHPVRVPARPCTDATVRIPLPGDAGPFTLHLPESLSPRLLGLRPVGGEMAPAPQRPRWAVYGDSITEGWFASRPALAWPARTARDLGLDHINLGYAGSGRGEIACAEQLASLPCDLLTLAFGTNCWSAVPHSAELLRETARLFLDLLRERRPDTPVLVVSPVLRPDAENTPNQAGATLAELRTALESVTEERTAAGDKKLALLRGGRLLRPEHLADGVHPNDPGHATLASAVTTALRETGFAAGCSG